MATIAPIVPIIPIAPPPPTCDARLRHVWHRLPSRVAGADATRGTEPNYICKESFSPSFFLFSPKNTTFVLVEFSVGDNAARGRGTGCARLSKTLQAMIDCFIPYENDAQAGETVRQLRQDPNVGEIHFLREGGPGQTEVLQWIARHARAHYTLLYTKYDTLRLGFHALTRMLMVAEDSGVGIAEVQVVHIPVGSALHLQEQAER